MEARGRYRWVVVAVVCLTTTAGFTQWASAFPLLSLWIKDLGISRAQGGFLTGLYYLPGILVALPGSWLFSRFPFRRVFLACWLLILLGGCVMATASGFLLLCLGRLVFSIGMNVHVVGAPKLLAGWFEGSKRLGIVMALYSVGVSLGALSGITLAGNIGNDHGWRTAAYFTVALSAAGFLLIGLLRQPPSFAAGQESSISFRPFQIGFPVWLLAAGYFFFNIASDSYLVFAPDCLVSRGLALDTASALVGSYAYAALCVKLSTSPFLKAGNAGWYVSAGCVAGIAGNALLLMPAVHPRISALVIGLAFGLAMPALYAMPAFLLGTRNSGPAYGLYQVFYSLGVFVQPIVGYTIDRTGSYVWGYMLLSLILLAGLGCAVATQRRWFQSRIEGFSRP
jgi:cyanate permease